MTALFKEKGLIVVKKADMEKRSRRWIEVHKKNVEESIDKYANGKISFNYVSAKFDDLSSIIMAYDVIELLSKSEIPDFQIRIDVLRNKFYNVRSTYYSI